MYAHPQKMFHSQTLQGEGIRTQNFQDSLKEYFYIIYFLSHLFYLIISKFSPEV